MAERIYQGNLKETGMKETKKSEELSREERIRQMTPFLLEWYEKNRRILPWRENPIPYYVWISEIMLQQTRVEAVKQYFIRFIGQLPDVEALAAVEEEELLKLWEGLGYYNRARNLKKAAQIVTEQYGGHLPEDYNKLSKLPGIGSYTAGAIASIAYGIAVPAVDGNVLRVLSRLTADDSDILKQSTKKSAEQLLIETMPQHSASAFNQAMMEIGAMVCLPNGEPHCSSCPLTSFCIAHEEGREEDYPVKKAKKARRVEERTILLLHAQDNQIALEKRDSKGLLAGLYEFPNLEGKWSEQDVLKYLKEQGLQTAHIRKLKQEKHIFSHVEWHMTGYEMYVEPAWEAENTPVQSRETLFVELSQIKAEYPVPNAFAAYKTHLGLDDALLEKRQMTENGE